MATDSNNNARVKAVPNCNSGTVNSVYTASVSGQTHPSQMSNPMQNNQKPTSGVCFRQTTVIYHPIFLPCASTNANRKDAIPAGTEAKAHYVNPLHYSSGTTEQMQCRMPQPEMQPQMSYNHGRFIPPQYHSPNMGPFAQSIPPCSYRAPQVTPNRPNMPPPCHGPQLSPHSNSISRPFGLIPPYSSRGPQATPNRPNIPPPCNGPQLSPRLNGMGCPFGQSIPPCSYHGAQVAPNRPNMPPPCDPHGPHGPSPRANGQNIPIPSFHPNYQYVPQLSYQVQSPVDPYGQYIPPYCSHVPPLLLDPYGMPIGSPYGQPDPTLYGQIPPHTNNCMSEFSASPYVPFVPGQDQFLSVPCMTQTYNFFVSYPPGPSDSRNQRCAKRTLACPLYMDTKSSRNPGQASHLNEQLPPKINIKAQPTRDITEQNKSPNLDKQLSTGTDKNLPVIIEEDVSASLDGERSVDPEDLSVDLESLSEDLENLSEDLENLSDDLYESLSTDLDEALSTDLDEKSMDLDDEINLNKETSDEKLLIDFDEKLTWDDEQLEVTTDLDEHELQDFDKHLSTDIDENLGSNVCEKQTDFDGVLSPTLGEQSPDLNRQSARLSDFLPLCLREQLLSNQSPTVNQNEEIVATPIVNLTVGIEPPPGFEKDPPLYVDLGKFYKRQDERPTGQLPLYLR